MDKAERGLIGVVMALHARFDFKAMITPESIHNLMCRAREVLPADAPDIFRRYGSVDMLSLTSEYLAEINITRKLR